LHPKRIETLEDELAQLEASDRREREWMESTTAKTQPRWKHADTFE
jgi:hypothetical protein